MSNELNYFDSPLDKLEFNDAERSVVINFASSQERDRIGDYLEVSGINTYWHRKNPIAYLDHGKLNQPLPIGRCETPDGEYTVTIDEELGLASAKIYLATGIPDFPPPTPELIYQLYKGGYLVGGSIGYRPLVAENLQPDPKQGHFQKALWLKETELQEVSIVGLPMSPSSVKSYLITGLYNNKPLNTEVKSLLVDSIGKIWSNGININMKKDVMSASDQSRGGAFVPPGNEDQTTKLLKALKAIIEEHEKPLVHGSSEEAISQNIRRERAEGKPERQAIAIAESEARKKDMKKENEVEENKKVKAEDKPDVAVEPVENAKEDVMREVKEHLESAADHRDTPDDLRVEHKEWAKALGDALEDVQSDKSINDQEEEGSAKDEDNAPHEDQDDLDLMRDVKEHLEDAANHEDMPKMMAAAHKHYAGELEKCMKSEEPELSEHEEKILKKSLNRIQAKLTSCENKVNRTFGK